MCTLNIHTEKLALPLGHEVIKWDNAMNNIDLATLSVTEMNLFTAICAQVVERGDEEVHLSYSALKELMHYKSRSRKRFALMVVKATEHIRTFTVQYEHGTKIGSGQLFYNIEADIVTGDISVSVNRKVLGVLNNLTNNFTLFLQPDWVTLDSKYAKIVYLMVMQWRTSNKDIIISVEDFRKKLAIPKSMTTSQVTKRIINPVKDQLNKDGLVPNFDITPIAKGRKYVEYRLTFDAIPKLKTTNKMQSARIGRLTEVAEAKSGVNYSENEEQSRKIIGNIQLSKIEVQNKLHELQKSQLPNIHIPLFKLGES